MTEIFKAAIERGASDIHIKSGDRVRARINGKLLPLTQQKLTHDQVAELAKRFILREEDRAMKGIIEELGEPMQFGIDDPTPLMAESGYRILRTVSFDELALEYTGTYARERFFRFQSIGLASASEEMAPTPTFKATARLWPAATAASTIGVTRSVPAPSSTPGAGSARSERVPTGWVRQRRSADGGELAAGQHATLVVTRLDRPVGDPPKLEEEDVPRLAQLAECPELLEEPGRVRHVHDHQPVERSHLLDRELPCQRRFQPEGVPLGVAGDEDEVVWIVGVLGRTSQLHVLAVHPEQAGLCIQPAPQPGALDAQLVVDQVFFVELL